MNTGEFAKLCQTEKRTLFHYDEIGLLKPAEVLDNGYRVYEEEQQETMDMIRILQAAGYSLKEISGIIRQDTKSRRDCFFRSRDKLAEQIRRLEDMKEYVERKEKLLEDYQQFKKQKHKWRKEKAELSYSSHPVDKKHHFFSFLNDGSDDGILIKEDGETELFHPDQNGIRKQGKALFFFLEVPSRDPDLEMMIEKRMKEADFKGEHMYYMHSLPHLLTDQNGKTVLSVLVFEKI